MLDCFSCPNAVITDTHLPALLALRDDLHRRRGTVSDADWETRYATAWSAVVREVLPRFTPAQLTAAGTDRPESSLLDLVEPPWHIP